MGGVYACSQNQTPIFLINPGFGLSKMWPEYKKIDEASLDVQKDLVKCVMVGTNDKYQVGYMPEIEKRNLDIKYFPSKHVPTENEIVNYIIPEIKKLV